MIASLFSLLLLAAPPALIPSPPAEKKVLGTNSYGSETIENLQGFGLIRLNGTTVTESLQVQGSLIANHATLHQFSVTGEANLTDTTIHNEGTVTGYIAAHKSKFEKSLTVTSQKAVFTACKLQGITIRKDMAYKAKQVLELKQGTIVDGPITFEGGNGEIYLYPGSQVLGSVTGGKIIKKH